MHANHQRSFGFCSIRTLLALHDRFCCFCARPMQALQAMAALSETVSMDSDTSRILEAGVDRPGRRGRKQAKPLRSAFSSGRAHTVA